VTLRAPSVIDTFRLERNDTPGPVMANATNAPTPFGFAYQRSGNLIVSHSGVVGDPANLALFQGSASSYRLARSGGLTPIDNVASEQRATCWVVVTGNDRYAFMTNTLSQSVSRFRLSRSGALTLLGQTATGPGFPADEALSRNSRYLYVLVPLGGPGGESHIDAYRVGPGGTLTPIGSTASNLPPGVSGLAAR
jgi:6-phosphogluconolactonase (cycloisomerase 2 family)